MKIYLAAIGAMLAALLGAVALAKELGSTRVDVELMAAPYRDAKMAGALTANTRVDILERRGAWLRVNSADKNGWLRLHQVRIGDGAEQKGSSGFSALWNVGTTGRSGTQGMVATTGIRGMSADELKNAKPDAKAVEQLERYRSNDNQARQHATAAGLKEKQVTVLPTPESIKAP